MPNLVKYAFTQGKIKLSDKDYQEIKQTYDAIDVDKEMRLMEPALPNNWFIALKKKLEYQQRSALSKSHTQKASEIEQEIDQDQTPVGRLFEWLASDYGYNELVFHFGSVQGVQRAKKKHEGVVHKILEYQRQNPITGQMITGADLMLRGMKEVKNCRNERYGEVKVDKPTDALNYIIKFCSGFIKDKKECDKLPKPKGVAKSEGLSHCRKVREAIEL